MSDTESQGPKHNMSTAPESLNSDFGIQFPPSQPHLSSLKAGAAPALHPQLNSHVRWRTYAHAFSQFSIQPVRCSRLHAIFIYVMQIKNIKTQENI